MFIVTHASANAPPSDTWIAAFYQDKGGELGDRLPLVFTGATELEAVNAAERWLMQEDAKKINQKANREAAEQRRKDKRAEKKMEAA